MKTVVTVSSKSTPFFATFSAVFWMTKRSFCVIAAGGITLREAGRTDGRKGKGKTGMIRKEKRTEGRKEGRKDGHKR
jgi:hypothetical protein